MPKVKIVDEEVIKTLKAKYKKRGNIDFFFRVGNLKLPIGNRQLGMSCAKLTRCNPPMLERINSKNSHKLVYKTRFGEIGGKK